MEQVRCYGCSNLLILARLEERRAYKRDCCGISFHHNCVRQEFLTSKCVSCNTYTDGLLLKNIPFPDLVVIEEERSEMAPSKTLCVICLEQESARTRLLATRCCRQFAHVYCLRKYYSIAELCSAKDYADEVTAGLYSENCFVCRGSPEQEAPLDPLIVQQLIPEINPATNDRRIQDANDTMTSVCIGLTSKISPLLSKCKAGFISCTYVMGQCSSEDGYVKQITPDLPTLRIFEPREFQEEVVKWIKQMLKDFSGLPLNEREFGENTITYFSLNKLIEIIMTFNVTHSYMQCRPSRFENAGPFDLHWIMKTLSKWKFTLRCFNVNTFEVKFLEQQQLE